MDGIGESRLERRPRICRRPPWMAEGRAMQEQLPATAMDGGR